MVTLLPAAPFPLVESAAAALEWPRLRESIAGRSASSLGREYTLALEPSTDVQWIESQQQRTGEIRAFLNAGGSFSFSGMFDPRAMLERAGVAEAALEAMEILAVLELTERIAAWSRLFADRTGMVRPGSSIESLSACLLEHDFAPLLRTLRGKIEADGSLSDDASPELRRIRRASEAQHRAIEASLRKASRSLREEGGSAADDIITVRGDRFVIPVRTDQRRRLPGVIHGSSSSGQTIFVEPLETIEQNNELVRLLDAEQAEIHRILVVLTAAIAAQAGVLLQGTGVLAEVESHFARARFAEEFHCIEPRFGDDLSLKNARHPLLEARMRLNGGEGPVPLSVALTTGARQLIVSGPNTGGKTVSLKTVGLLTLMALAGMPVPADEAVFPRVTAVFADIGDAQSIERNLSSFSAHVLNLDLISRQANRSSLVLLDELGSATDPEEGAALAVAVAAKFLELGCWCCITTHLTSLKVYAATHPGVLNAAVGFDQATLTPTYELRLGVPGASAGLNIAERLGMQPDIIAGARAQLTRQQEDIGALLDQLHNQLTEAATERVSLTRRLQEVAIERERLEREGRTEQKQRTRELEQKLARLLEDFEVQLREVVKAIDDKTIAQKIARDSALRMSRVRREFSEQFSSTVLAHVTRADQDESKNKRPNSPAEIERGDLVSLKSLGRQARVERVIDAKLLEVAVGQMKMKVPRSDVVAVEKVRAVHSPEAARRRGSISVRTLDDPGYTPLEINVIGQTAADAEQDVERYIDRAFLAGIPRVRIIHGTGMGVLRRTLREFLRSHPHVATFNEAAQNEGGQGATIVDLRQ